MSFEIYFLDAIRSCMQSGWMDTVMPFITALGNGGILWILLALLLLIIPRTRRAGEMMIIALIFEGICCNVILKPLVARIRPCDVNTAVKLLIAHPNDYSFPSGHTGASFTAVSALFLGRNRLWIPSLVLAVLIAFSRMYLYVHYPSDVLAGMILGILTGWISKMVMDRFGKKLPGE